MTYRLDKVIEIVLSAQHTARPPRYIICGKFRILWVMIEITGIPPNGTKPALSAGEPSSLYIKPLLAEEVGR